VVCAYLVRVVISRRINMFRSLTIALFAMLIFTVGTVYADSGCRNGRFVGSYVSPNLDVDLFGDGSVIHSFVFQLNLHSDGTADQYWTGLPDYIINLGTGSPWIGSWTCRQDGKLVVTMVRGSYLPVDPSPPNAPNPDISLTNHVRNTYLFNIDSVNTITRIQGRARVYGVHENPADPTAGTLGDISNTHVEYTRLSASDADLQ
jgi:hypothetical protein